MGVIRENFFNMYSLYIVGPRVEDFFGKWKFILIYFKNFSNPMIRSGIDRTDLCPLPPPVRRDR